jgi:hypothetical protein
MYDEVRMMHFKVKPVHGDLSVLNINNHHFMEILWSLGKMDEFFQANADSLSQEDKSTFMRVFDGMYKSFQTELNSISIKSENDTESTALEMEIFRKNHYRLRTCTHYEKIPCYS